MRPPRRAEATDAASSVEVDVVAARRLWRAAVVLVMRAWKVAGWRRRRAVSAAERERGEELGAGSPRAKVRVVFVCGSVMRDWVRVR